MTTACIADTHYLSSPDFLATVLHCMSCLEVPILSFGTYCIVFKTPTQMRSVKWLMLNVHFWSALYAVSLSVFFIPYLRLPAMAGYGLGLIDAPALWLYVCLTLLAASGASVVACYENRYYVLFARNTWWSRARKPAMTVVYCLVPLMFTPPYLNIPEQESARRTVLRELPCLPDFSYSDREMFVLTLDYGTLFLCLFAAAGLLGSLLILFFFANIFNLWFGKMMSFSMKTHHLQRMFTLALAFQSAFMLVIVAAPVFTILAIIVTWHHDQTLNNVAFITLSFHGVGTTLVMIMVHRPYRTFAFSPFRRKSKRFSPGGPF
ncbi:unnamed protein product [Caenorhabditis sp. 36 PRJEB53466]|nr:unnamed protein product [Caenorhabditis sp. 36 PRJEB53466]